ncbi:MAG: hypothetical protein HQL83_07635 [Magnetococcales bacterium]|nr:hypothetical protein [Magnetococcales bacterium]
MKRCQNAFRPWWIPLGWLMALMFANVAWATPEQQVHQALERYRQAQETQDPSARQEGFRQAQRLFATLVETVTPNADLYANLGAAALQAGDIGRAIWAFRSALALDPGHERSLTNLHFARGLLPSWLPRPEAHEPWDRLSGWALIPAAQRSLPGGVLFLLAAAGIALAIRFDSLLTRSLALIPILLWLLVSFPGLLFDREKNDHGVILQEETLARAADSINAPVSFSHPLPAGTEVRVLEHRDGWTRIALANDHNAWIRASALIMIDIK